MVLAISKWCYNSWYTDFNVSLCIAFFSILLLCAEYGDVAAYRLSLGEDTKAINQLVWFGAFYVIFSSSFARYVEIVHCFAPLCFKINKILCLKCAEYSCSRRKGNGLFAVHISQLCESSTTGITCTFLPFLFWSFVIIQIATCHDFLNVHM